MFKRFEIEIIFMFYGKRSIRIIRLCYIMFFFITFLIFFYDLICVYIGITNHTFHHNIFKSLIITHLLFLIFHIIYINKFNNLFKKKIIY